jgi:hypothetical protein
MAVPPGAPYYWGIRVLSLLTVIVVCALMGWLVYTQQASVVASGDPAPAPVFVHQVQRPST